MHEVVFLPGIIAPCAQRYAPLLKHLENTRAVLLDLAVYREDAPPQDFSIRTEVDALERAANEAGLERFHLYGHSGGGAAALAFATTHGERLLSLAVDEPATDFTDECNATYGWPEFDHAMTLPAREAMTEFLRLQVASGVQLPPPPESAPPPWMAKRPAGITVFVHALRAHHIEPDQYRAFDRPVYYSWGSLTHPRWHAMAARLASLFPDCSPEEYEGFHHLNTSHMAEPARVAARLHELWARAEG